MSFGDHVLYLFQSYFDVVDRRGSDTLTLAAYSPLLKFYCCHKRGIGLSPLSCLMLGVVSVPIFPSHPPRNDTLLMFSNIVSVPVFQPHPARKDTLLMFSNIVSVPVFQPHPARKDTLLMFSKIVESCGSKYTLTSTSYSHMKKLSCKSSS